VLQLAPGESAHHLPEHAQPSDDASGNGPERGRGHEQRSAGGRQDQRAAVLVVGYPYREEAVEFAGSRVEQVARRGAGLPHLAEHGRGCGAAAVLVGQRGEAVDHGPDVRLEAGQRPRDGGGEGRAGAVEVGVLDERRGQARAHAIAVGLVEHAREDSRVAPEAGGRRVGSVEAGGEQRLDRAEPAQSLRQGEQGRVHHVVAVEVGVEDQIRGVADVPDQPAHVGDQGGERRLERAGEERLPAGGTVDGEAPPAGLERQGCERLAPAFAEAGLVELQWRGELPGQPAHLGQRGARRARGVVHGRGIGCCPGPRAHTQLLESEQAVERVHEGALDPVALALEGGEADALLERIDRAVEEDGERQRPGQDGEHQALVDSQVESRH
jgi:hypothetical protein